MGRFATALLGTCLLALAGAAPAVAGWQAGGPASAYAGAQTVPAGEAPAASVAGRAVTLTWGAVSMAGGGAVGGYLVRRYDASGEAQVVGTGCVGVLGALSCVEQLVPGGEWRYTVTPVLQLWQGAESAPSAPVAIAGRPPPRVAERPSTESHGGSAEPQGGLPAPPTAG